MPAALADLLDTTVFLARNLGGAAVILASAWAFGQTLLRRLVPRAGGLEGFALAATLGLGLMAQGLFILGIAGLLERPFIFAALATGHLVAWRTWRGVFPLPESPRALRARYGCTAAVLAAVLLPSLVLALYPPTAFDASAYHLPYVRDFLGAGKLTFVSELSFPVFPQVVEMGFLLAFVLAGDVLAHLTQFLAMLLVAALVYAWGERRFSRRAALWATALWLGSPLVVRIAGAGFIDVGLALFVTAAFYAWERWRDDDQDATGWLTLAGTFVGLAMGTKYLGLFFAGMLAFLTAVRLTRQRRWRAARRALLLAALGAFLAAAPWYLRIYAHTGSPLFPFYAPIFGASEWTTTHDRQLMAGSEVEGIAQVAARQTERMVEGLGFLALTPWNAVFNRVVFHHQAPLTPLYLVLIPLGLPFALARRETWHLQFVLVVYALFWLTTVRDLRFLVPALPLFHLVLVAGIARSASGAPSPPSPLSQREKGSRAEPGSRRRALEVAVALLLVAPGPGYAVYKIAEQELPPTRPRAREAYLADRVAGYRTLRAVDDPAATVYGFYTEYLRYYAPGRLLGGPFGPYRHERIQGAMRRGGAAAYEALRGFDACYLLVRYARWPIRLPEDPSFNEHFLLLPEREPGFELYRLRAPECRPPTEE